MLFWVTNPSHKSPFVAKQVQDVVMYLLNLGSLTELWVIRFQS